MYLVRLNVQIYRRYVLNCRILATFLQTGEGSETCEEVKVEYCALVHGMSVLSWNSKLYMHMCSV